MRCSLTLLLASLWLLAAGSVAQAQFQSGLGNAGRSQPGLFGGSRSVGSGGLQSGFGNAPGMNQGGLPQGSMQQQLGANAGQLTGSERYLRGNRQPGQFVGGAGADPGNFVGAAGGSLPSSGLGGNLGLGGFGGLGGYGGQFGLGQGFGMQSLLGGQFNRMNPLNRMNQQRTGPGIRTKIGLGFTPSVANTPTVASERLTGLLQRSSRIEAVTPIQVELAGRTAILRGTVRSPLARDLAQRVVLLEPGISEVQNELVVAGQDTEELPSPGRSPQ